MHGKTEAQRGKVTCSGHAASEWQTQGKNLGSLTPKRPVLTTKYHSLSTHSQVNPTNIGTTNFENLGYLLGFSSLEGSKCQFRSLTLWYCQKFNSVSLQLLLCLFDFNFRLLKNSTKISEVKFHLFALWFSLRILYLRLEYFCSPKLNFFSPQTYVITKVLLSTLPLITMCCPFFPWCIFLLNILLVFCG